MQQTKSAGHLWCQLRATPADAALWQRLAACYAAQGLPWHQRYAQTQARRCAAGRGQVLGDLPGGDLPTPVAGAHWGEGAGEGAGDALLMRSGPPWAGWAQVLARLEQAVAKDAGDWLSWLYLARCREMAPPGVSEAPASEVLPGAMPQTVREAVHAAVRQAIAHEPLPGESGHLLAQWRLRAGQPAQALAALQAVLLQAPQRHGSWLLQAQAHMQLGHERQAREAFERAGQSQNPQLLALLADKLFAFNFAFEAQGVCEAVVRLNPHSPAAWLRLAEIQAKLWQLESAQASLARALAIAPDHPQALSLQQDLQASGHSRAQFDHELARFEAEGLQGNAQGAQRLLMQSLYQAHLAPEAVARLHQRVGQAMQAQARQAMGFERLPAPQPLPWDGQRRLRVGYISGDLHRQHPVNVFMLPVLQLHDHRALEVFIYQTGTFIDEYTRQARACADHWREAAQLSDVALHQLVVDDRIDVLVDLAGHTASHRLGVFALRAAPVQMSYLGYPHSTGLPGMDWMIGDAVVSPPEHAPLFSEKIARVSGTVFCWAPVEEYPLPPDAVTVPSRPVVFGSFNNLLKMDDATVAVWARILHECPQARLLLKSAVLADPLVLRQTHERFAACGIGPERLDLRGPSELSKMMQEYLQVDVALDPFPYNGGTTSLQALWMGCPLVSLQGGNFVSRMGASFLTHLGRTEWLARSVDEYVAKALGLAQQVRQQPWARQAQRAAMQASGLCQIGRHTREIEGIYRQAFVERIRPGADSPS